MAQTPKENLISILIDGRWTTMDFAVFFNNISVVLSRGNDLSADSEFDQEHSFFPIYSEVQRITFASPGQIDIAGLGRAAEAIKDLILDLIRLTLEAKDRKQARQARSLEMQAVALDVQSKFLRNLSELHDLNQKGVISEWQMQRLGTEFNGALIGLAEAVEEGRIRGAK
jgi:hypothetical protein